MKRKSRALLAPAELEIMEGVWRLDQPTTVRYVQDLLYPRTEKAYTTVQTTMNVMVGKGFLERRKAGPVNLYTAAITQEEATSGATRSFVSRIFEGSFGALATYLVESGNLSDEELGELRSRIEAHQSGEQGGTL